VLALLPFPSVLDMMARDMVWTEQLGNAVLTQRADVMDAVQRMRRKAESYKGGNSVKKCVGAEEKFGRPCTGA
jgi:hypothetical protein